MITKSTKQFNQEQHFLFYILTIRFVKHLQCYFSFLVVSSARMYVGFCMNRFNNILVRKYVS